MNIDEIYKSRCKELIEYQESEAKDYNVLNNYEYFADLMSEEQFKEIIRLKQNRKNKRNRTKLKIKEMLKYFQIMNDGSCLIIFGTCTFDPKSYSLKERTKVKNLEKWLKSHFWYSILNKDFGKLNEREHFHFIGITTEPLVETGKRSKKNLIMYNLEKQDYKMGFEPNLELVDFNEYDFDKTMNYLLKLNNHSSKDTTSSRLRIIKKDLLEVCFKKEVFDTLLECKKV